MQQTATPAGHLLRLLSPLARGLWTCKTYKTGAGNSAAITLPAHHRRAQCRCIGGVLLLCSGCCPPVRHSCSKIQRWLCFLPSGGVFGSAPQLALWQFPCTRGYIAMLQRPCVYRNLGTSPFHAQASSPVRLDAFFAWPLVTQI